MRPFTLCAMLALGLSACSTAPNLPPAPAPVQLPPPAPLPAVVLEAVDFAALPGWAEADASAALAAFQRSCAVMTAKPDTTPMGPYGGTLADWRAVCAAAAMPQPARSFFEAYFTPLAVSEGGQAEGRFTGYFEPEIQGRRTAQGAFAHPVYGRPEDLVTVDLGQFRPALKGETIAGRVERGKLLPYPDRAAITAKGLKAPVLFYTDDPIALFFLQIQGSGRVTFEDGTRARVAYAAQNGQPYTAIGKSLIARGVPKEAMSLQVIRTWLAAHPEEAAAVMNTNASYVFFALQPLGDPMLGAKGSQGVALTPLSSLAIDARYFGLGTPFFVAGPAPLGRLFIGQDTGGAIRGPIRGDVYFGYGKEAEAAAGGMNQTGRWYVLVPKPVAARLKAVS